MLRDCNVSRDTTGVGNYLFTSKMLEKVILLTQKSDNFVVGQQLGTLNLDALRK
jgi:hypothetical protein